MAFNHQETIEIAAPADLVYELVADITSTVDHSPEVRQIEWISEPAQPVVGARFRGRNRWRGFTWWRTVRIVQADHGEVFVFETEPGRGIKNDTVRWTYRFEPTSPNSTRISESYVFHAPWWIRTMDTLLGRPKALRVGMKHTLANLKHAAEHPSAASSRPVANRRDRSHSAGR